MNSSLNVTRSTSSLTRFNNGFLHLLLNIRLLRSRKKKGGAVFLSYTNTRPLCGRGYGYVIQKATAQNLTRNSLNTTAVSSGVENNKGWAFLQERTMALRSLRSATPAESHVLMRKCSPHPLQVSTPKESNRQHVRTLICTIPT